MDDDTRLKFEDMDRKLVALDKRIDDQGKRFDDVKERFADVKWLVGGTSIIFTVIFGVLTLISGWNYKSEREGLRDFQKEIKELVSKADETRLELQGVNRQDLAGQEVAAEFVNFLPSAKPNEEPNPKGVPHLFFSFIVKNSGENTSGDTYIKVYTEADVKLTQKSSDDPAYVYEDYATPDSLSPRSIPAKMSITHNLRFLSPDAVTTKPGKHRVLLRVYYGKAKVVSASFYLVTGSRKG